MTVKYLTDHLEFFQEISLFNGLTNQQIKSLVNKMTLREVSTGTVIIQEGAADTEMFILLEGEVEISKRLTMLIGDQAPQEKSLIRLSARQHSFFGEMALLEENPQRSASITMLSEGRLAVLQKKDLVKVLDADPEMGAIVYKNIASELTRRLQKANRDILKLTTAFTLALES